MADVKVKTTRVALNTALGTQDITIAGFGTPKAAMFFVTRGITDDALADHADLSVGFTDGTTSGVLDVGAEDGIVGSADSWRTINSTDVLALHETNENAKTAAATFNAWITDGVQIDITDAPDAAYLLTVVLIGGADVSNANVSALSLDRSIANDITTIGFEPDLVFSLVSESSVAQDTPRAKFSMGLAHNGASVEQRSLTSVIPEDFSSTSDAGLVVDNASIGKVMNNAASAVLTTFSISDFDASGYTITGDNAGSATRLMLTLNLKFSGSPGIKIVDIDSPTSTGAAATTGVGFQPGFGMLFMADADAVGSVQDVDDDGIGISVFDDTNLFSNTYSSDDGATTTLVKSLSSNQLRLIDGGNNSTHTATLASLDADGWTFNYSVADVTTKKWFALAIEGTTAARTLTDIDGDNNVQVGQTNITITATGLDSAPVTQTVTLGGQALTVTSWNSGHPIVTIPVDIQLLWGRTDLQLAVTDDTGTITLDNVTLSNEAGWSYVTFSGNAPNPATTQSGYELVQIDYAYNLLAGDRFLYKDETGLAFDTDTIVTLNPEATITSEYRYWNDSAGTLSVKTAYGLAETQVLTGALITSPNTFYSPTVNVISQPITVPLLTNPTTFYSPTLVLPSTLQAITPELITENAAFRAATVSLAHKTRVTLIS